VIAVFSVNALFLLPIAVVVLAAVTFVDGFWQARS